MLQIFWDTGKAEYLSSEFGHDLSTFTDANYARCLCTRWSTSVYFILFNGVLISWPCKKQPTTALHSTGSKLTALHRGFFKTILLRSFLQSIGIYLNTPTPTYEDNKGSIHLICTYRLTDTVRHHTVKYLGYMKSTLPTKSLLLIPKPPWCWLIVLLSLSIVLNCMKRLAMPLAREITHRPPINTIMIWTFPPTAITTVCPKPHDFLLHSISTLLSIQNAGGCWSLLAVLYR